MDRQCMSSSAAAPIKTRGGSPNPISKAWITGFIKYSEGRLHLAIGLSSFISPNTEEALMVINKHKGDLATNNLGTKNSKDQQKI